MDYNDILECCVSLAYQAGEHILEIYNANDYSVENKADGSPLTIADLVASDIIVSGLRERYPDYAILCEETSDDLSRLDNDYCFIVDPLDGTKGFINRDGSFTVNIALAYKHKAVVGVVYAPVDNEMFLVAEGIGAFKEFGSKRTKLSVSDNTENLIMARSQNHATPEEDKLAAKHNITRFIICGSSIKGCRVAEGNADVYYRFGPTNEWDTAAMQCVVERAGGIFRQLDGSEMLYNRKDTRNRVGFCAVNLKENLWV